MAVARVSGVVLSTDRRTGTSKTSGNAYDFTEVKALVANEDVTTFTVRGSTNRAAFSKGDLIDVLVDLDVYAGRLASTFLRDWSAADEVA